MLEETIAEWRSHVRRRQSIHTVDVEELEDHLRSQVAELREAGLDEDEAFLIAVKRIGELEALSREFAVSTPSACGSASFSEMTPARAARAGTGRPWWQWALPLPRPWPSRSPSSSA